MRLNRFVHLFYSTKIEKQKKNTKFRVHSIISLRKFHVLRTTGSNRMRRISSMYIFVYRSKLHLFRSTRPNRNGVFLFFLIEKSPFFAYAFKIDESIQLLREVEFNWKRLVSHHLQYPHTAHGQQQHRLSILYTQQSASIRSSASVSLFFKLIE